MITCQSLFLVFFIPSNFQFSNDTKGILCLNWSKKELIYTFYTYYSTCYFTRLLITLFFKALWYSYNTYIIQYSKANMCTRRSIFSDVNLNFSCFNSFTLHELYFYIIFIYSSCFFCIFLPVFCILLQYQKSCRILTHDIYVQKWK